MALKTKHIKIENKKSRDNGKEFIITEFSVVKLDKFANKVVTLLAKGMGETPDFSLGALNLVNLGVSAFKRINSEDLQPLLDEMLEAIEFVTSKGVSRPIDVELDVEDIATLWTLRAEFIKLHVDFLMQEQV